MQTALPHRAPAPPRRGRPPTPGLREKILRAAEVIFARRDYHEVQIDEVAGACGVGKGTLYRYFPSKQQLFLAVMFDGIERLRVELEAAARMAESPAQRIHRIVHRTLAFFWDRRFFFSLIHRSEHKMTGDAREWFRHRTALSRVVEATLDTAVAAGHIRPIDTRIAAEILFGMMRGVNRYRAEGDRLEELVATVVEVFMCGVGTSAGRRIAARRCPARRRSSIRGRASHRS